MTQDERWMKQYEEAMEFMELNHRNPSRHRLEEHDVLNWIKHNRKLRNAGKLRESRVEMFEKLVVKCKEYKRKNQYQ